jgi:hypothetical protein
MKKGQKMNSNANRLKREYVNTEKLLREKIQELQEHPLVKNMGEKVTSGLKMVGDQAKLWGSNAKDLAVKTGLRLKIAHYNTRINSLYMAIGEEVYEQTKKKKKSSSSQIPQLIQQIREIEHEIADIEKRLSKY